LEKVVYPKMSSIVATIGVKGVLTNPRLQFTVSFCHHFQHHFFLVEIAPKQVLPYNLFKGDFVRQKMFGH